MKIRNVEKLVTGHRTEDGAGVKLVRVVSHRDVEDVDPFLMLDAFDSINPDDYIRGFPLHPHRGIETFTYLIEGEIDHRDTLGNAGRIMGGQAQWMNAGRGILHEEMPQPAKRLYGFQLWINLPKKHKMVAPTYCDLRAEDMPTVQEDGAVVRVVAGEYKDAQGAKGRYVQPSVLDITVEGGAEFSLPTPAENTVFVYVLEGGGAFGEPTREVDAHTAAIFGEGDALRVRAGAGGIRFALFSGVPLRQPIAWGGPIVMNTQEELQQAFDELDNGTFIQK